MAFRVDMDALDLSENGMSAIAPIATVLRHVTPE